MSILASAAKILSAAKSAFEIVKAVIEAGKDAKPLIDIALAVLKKDDLTDADLDDMHNRIDALRAELHAPLPAPEPGEEA
jgi:hypothetical protein